MYTWFSFSVFFFFFFLHDKWNWKCRENLLQNRNEVESFFFFFFFYILCSIEVPKSFYVSYYTRFPFVLSSFYSLWNVSSEEKKKIKSNNNKTKTWLNAGSISCVQYLKYMCLCIKCGKMFIYKNDMRHVHEYFATNTGFLNCFILFCCCFFLLCIFFLLDDTFSSYSSKIEHTAHLFICAFYSLHLHLQFFFFFSLLFIFSSMLFQFCFCIKPNQTIK